jgi:hypothetical protein
VAPEREATRGRCDRTSRNPRASVVRWSTFSTCAHAGDLLSVTSYFAYAGAFELGAIHPLPTPSAAFHGSGPTQVLDRQISALSPTGRLPSVVRSSIRLRLEPDFVTAAGSDTIRTRALRPPACNALFDLPHAQDAVGQWLRWLPRRARPWDGPSIRAYESAPSCGVNCRRCSTRCTASWSHGVSSSA